MTRRTCIRLCLGFLFVAILGGQGAERSVAPTRHDIRPLLPGQPIPDITFTTLEGKALKLRESVSEQPVVLVVYRGGW